MLAIARFCGRIFSAARRVDRNRACPNERDATRLMSTLERRVAAEVAHATTDLFAMVTPRLSPTLRDAIDLLVEVSEDGRFRVVLPPEQAGTRIDAIQLQLNRGEFRHILAESLSFANQGGFRSGDYEELMNKASCLSLLSNAALVWNTVHIARIVDQLRAAGPEVRDEDLARVSPLAHAHVNGSYFQSPRRHAEAASEPVMA
jgi:Tn3 transposase DDE domain